MTFSDPKTWCVPNDWHADWQQNAVSELEALKSFSIAILKQWPELVCELDLIEEGYLKVDLSRNDLKLAEIYANVEKMGVVFSLYIPIDQPNEQEHHFRVVAEGIELLQEIV
ncbi:hypothetical protein Pan241w_48780 [Gimesia alba]|uniref:Uncharacterized protein n=1 Tax=Gimesia alba TaxID=2527973 RepID=A0A517RLR8_9PLAN|nr:hypothetical protein [Gimesia alba]QDT44762.1 hypothetical protein Pan241w_48780 [Gimesia alba]